MKKKFQIRNSDIVNIVIPCHFPPSIFAPTNPNERSFRISLQLYYALLHCQYIFHCFHPFPNLSIPHYYCTVTTSLFAFYLYVPLLSKMLLVFSVIFMSRFCSWLYRNLPEGGVSAASHTFSANVLDSSMKHCCYLHQSYFIKGKYLYYRREQAFIAVPTATKVFDI